MTKTLKQAKRDLTKTFFRGLQENDGYTVPEAWEPINTASRHVVAAMLEEHGEVWLGKVNCYTDEEKATPIWKHEPGETVYNFGADFVIPAFDRKLNDLILERHNPAIPFSMDRNKMEVDLIHERLDEIGGVSLHWA